MPQGSDQVGPLVGIDEDVPYSAADANALVAACRASATLIEGQAGTRAWAVSTAETDFEGCFSRVFADNARVQVGLLGVSRTALKAVFQAACLTARCSSSTSLGVLYPRAEWSRF